MSEPAPKRALGSAYMRFAKLETGARYNLASSGVAECTFEDLAAEASDLVISDPSPDGWPPLREIIADRFSVDSACVVIPGGGCSFANHLAMAAVIEPGDTVSIETPTYELLSSTSSHLGGRLVHFERAFESGWRLPEPSEVARSAPRLAVLTDLHNPSSAPSPETDIEALSATVPLLLIDEVYRELTFDGAPRTSFRAGANVIVTGSLTKAYGLGGLRCGWILAPAELAERMRRLNDLFGVKPVHVAERLALRAFQRLDRLASRAHEYTGANRGAYVELLGDHPELEQVVFPTGTTVFPRLRRGDGEAFCRMLMDRFETSAVPGRYFGAADHIRVGLGGEPMATREGLARVAEALEIWNQTARPE